MVVCICNNINDKTIATMVSNGAGLETIQKETGATTCCGCCHEMVCSLISKGQDTKKEGK